MRDREKWREYIIGRAELHCRLLELLPDDQPLASLRPAGLATMLGALCAELTYRASVSDKSEQEIEQGIEQVMWNRIRHDREAA